MFTEHGKPLSGKKWVALKRAFWLGNVEYTLTAEAVQSAALTLQSIDHIHGGDGLSLGVLGVGDGITDHVLQENLQHTTSLLVDEAGDSLHTTTASQAADSGLCDSLDVITENLAMTLGASFSESFTSLASSGHFL